MAAHMLDLPSKPTFAVFGLDSTFDGYRWLTIWNDRQHLYTITLGHGHPEAGAWLAVTTVLKTPGRRVSADISVGPTGYSDAVWDAAARLAALAHPGDRAAERALLERESAAAAPDADESALGPDWHADEMLIADRPRPCRSREVNGAWATLIDLPDVAISVTGPAGARPAVLANVVDQLEAYI